MPNFNASALKKGKEAIIEANESRGQGNSEFRPFLPSIYWKSDKDERYLWILNPLEEIPRLMFHPFVEVDGKDYPEQIIARTDPAIGERHDPIQDKWAYDPKFTNILIAVELEPTFEEVGGRQKPVGFTVKTREFERRVRDDEGELTDEREEVISPCVGVITQSPFNFGNVLEAFDSSEAPIHQTALKITRLGEKTNVTYSIKGYDNVDVDLSPLIDYIDQVSYIQNPEEVLSAIDGLTDEESAVVIGQYLLDAKLDELADPENYDAVLNAISKPNRYAKEKTSKVKEKAIRPAKPSQRRRPVEDSASEDTQDSSPAEPEVTKSSPAVDRLAKLRAKSAKA